MHTKSPSYAAKKWTTLPNKPGKNTNMTNMTNKCSSSGSKTSAVPSTADQKISAIAKFINTVHDDDDNDDEEEDGDDMNLQKGRGLLIDLKNLH